MVDMLINSVPSLNIPPIEPMEISSVGIDHNQKSNAFNMQSTFKNAKIHGLTTSNVKKTSAKFKNFSMKAEAFTKRLDFVGDYKMTGQILLFPISGEGFSNVSMNELITKHEIHGDYYEGKDNQTYIKITSYKIKFLPKWVTFIFDNLFNGDKLLGDTINNFMNSNWEPVFFGIIPDYEKSFGEKFKAVANTLFNQVPANHIFLN
ncbi:CLUMA_CG005698, isoform A [Clunio marinus]|uniref:CLUMA_CG005698, isoform A n=1 Tax=Clunio marinus TaxID=568069 RepID=A0A1J1HXU1_9DIPT|nr:CLUMA_CG005698, isoform A [Clunio marinus]